MKNKDVIYIDVEDEITNIIDKVNTSKSKVVALVLPKRATVFQSVVNMKLLKKKADDAGKNVVLVTSEAGILPLAGATGVHVAHSLQATPVIPPNPNEDFNDNTPIDIDEDEATVADPEDIDKNSPIGELAGLAVVGAAAGAAVKAKADPIDSISIDNDALPGDNAAADSSKGEQTDKSKKSKKAKGLNGKSTKVPNFEKFRKYLIIGGIALVALILIWIIGFKVLPKATITIQTNTSSVNSNLTLNLSQADQNLIASSNTVPAKYETVTKTSTSTAVNTTGTKTIGTAATGSITITNPCIILQGSTTPVNVPAGTVFTDSSGSYNFTNNAATVVPAYSAHGGHCVDGVVNVAVTATQVGSGYNLNSGTTFSSSYSGISSFNMTNNNKMNGGSSSTVQAVSQADITSAQSQLQTPNSSQIESQLESTLNGEGYTPITETYVAGTPTYTPSATVGTQANSVTVTSSATYSMYGVKESDLNTLVTNNVNQQINPSTQSIIDTGVSNAKFTVVTNTPSSAQVTMQTSASVAAKLDATTIAQQSAGQKSADIVNTISQVPGVTKVTVKYSPFWVTATPSNVKKITVVIEKNNGS
jgi:hypothetical protein